RDRPVGARIADRHALGQVADVDAGRRLPDLVCDACLPACPVDRLSQTLGESAQLNGSDRADAGKTCARAWNGLDDAALRQPMRDAWRGRVDLDLKVRAGEREVGVSGIRLRVEADTAV